jgi:hypothetical protein
MIANFYSNNDMILTQAEIRTLENHFKKTSLGADSWTQFSTPIATILSKSVAVADYYQHQFDNALGLQGGKILEIVVGETLGRIFNANYVGNNIFEGEQYSIILTGEDGKGSGASYDIKIIDKINNISYIGEVKDEIARCGECDLKYDEEGHLFPSSQVKNWNDAWWPILNAFNASTSMFNIFGHNFKISHFEDACTAVARSYFDKVDFLFTCKQNKLITIPMENFDAVKMLFCFDNSEIRSKGKNTANIFTPNYLNKMISNSEYFIQMEGSDYIFNQNILSKRNPRGSSISKYFNFIPGFVVEKKGVTFNDNNTCLIKAKSIKQLNSNISIHFKIKAKYDEIVKICKGE